MFVLVSVKFISRSHQAYCPFSSAAWVEKNLIQVLPGKDLKKCMY